jgi:hypothetical protein
MKWKSWRVAIIGIVLLLSGNTACADDFYGVGTKITTLPYTISQPGFYYLSGNLTYSGSGNAITVSADDVTLDLMGFSLTNSGAPGITKGINMYGRTNVEIRNGTVGGFYTGVGGDGTNHRAMNVRAPNNTYGIGFDGYHHLIKGCNASNNTTTGIYLQSGLISDCVASNNVYGIKVLGPANVLGNIVFNNSGYNFDLGNGVATAIMVDRNSAFGRNPNYYVILNTEVVQWGINAGAP